MTWGEWAESEYAPKPDKDGTDYFYIDEDHYVRYMGARPFFVLDTNGKEVSASLIKPVQYELYYPTGSAGGSDD